MWCLSRHRSAAVAAAPRACQTSQTLWLATLPRSSSKSSSLDTIENFSRYMTAHSMQLGLDAANVRGSFCPKVSPRARSRWLADLTSMQQRISIATAGLVARSQLLVSWVRMPDIAALNGVHNMQIGTASSFDMTAAALSCHQYRDVLPLHHTFLRYFHIIWLYHFSQVPSHSPVPRSWHCRPSQQICG